MILEYKDILVDSRGEIGLMTLNSPQTINALSRNMIAEIIAALETFSGDGNAKVIIIKANGKHFCSGHNLREMVNGSRSDYKFIFDQCTRMMNLIHDIDQIVIAQVHGIATAGGCQLAAECDLVVAEEKARFGTPGVKIGLFCTTPMVALSRSVGRKIALDMLLSGRMISAREAEIHGLVSRVVPSDELEKATMDLAESVAEASPLVLGIGKRAFYNQIELDERRAYDYAVNVITLNLMAEDAQEGIGAFLEKRKPTWRGR
ncbi:MAG: enoyl-CoA hydratase [Deltaproteobacteria bacterium]|nr:enoyl-CoA hydratase [Deltaproteobacteria bacterium]